jgi:hypothetical protein
VGWPRQCLEGCRNHQLEVSFRKYPIRVLPVHYLALFGDLYMTGERTTRLRNYRMMGWPTTAPDRSTASVKERELNVALVSNSMQGAMGLEYLPGAGEHPAVFV